MSIETGATSNNATFSNDEIYLSPICQRRHFGFEAPCSGIENVSYSLGTINRDGLSTEQERACDDLCGKTTIEILDFKVKELLGVLCPHPPYSRHDVTCDSNGYRLRVLELPGRNEDPMSCISLLQASAYTQLSRRILNGRCVYMNLRPSLDRKRLRKRRMNEGDVLENSSKAIGTLVGAHMSGLLGDRCREGIAAQFRLPRDPRIESESLYSCDLVFDSKFESGNLMAAFRIEKSGTVNHIIETESEKCTGPEGAEPDVYETKCIGNHSHTEYDLVLEPDTNTRGNTQWFYFGVENLPFCTVCNEPLSVKLNIVNMGKSTSLFQRGMSPVVWSVKRFVENGIGWTRAIQPIIESNGDQKDIGTKTSVTNNSFCRKKVPENSAIHIVSISYGRTHTCRHLITDVTRKTMSSRDFGPIPGVPRMRMVEECTATALNESRCLSILLRGVYQGDTIYIAYAYPYTFSRLSRFIEKAENSAMGKNCLQRLPLCRTLSGNRLDSLTITRSGGQPEALYHKKIISITGRVHPGESVSSFIMEGLIDFLLGPSAIAENLRNAFIFKIVPMLNPDGVILGNYRTNTYGHDLNRTWDNPSEESDPTIYYVKKQISRLDNLFAIIDLHAHSRRFDWFTYGCYVPAVIGTPNNESVTKWEKFLRKFRLDNSDKRLSHVHILPVILSSLDKTQCRESCKISSIVGETMGAFQHSNFSVQNSSFRVQKNRTCTARICLFLMHAVPFTYTVEASFCGISGRRDFRGRRFEPRQYTISSYHHMGVVICIGLYKSRKHEINSKRRETASRKTFFNSTREAETNHKTVTGRCDSDMTSNFDSDDYSADDCTRIIRESCDHTGGDSDSDSCPDKDQVSTEEESVHSPSYKPKKNSLLAKSKRREKRKVPRNKTRSVDDQPESPPPSDSCQPLGGIGAVTIRRSGFRDLNRSSSSEGVSITQKPRMTIIGDISTRPEKTLKTHSTAKRIMASPSTVSINLSDWIPDDFVPRSSGNDIKRPAPRYNFPTAISPAFLRADKSCQVLRIQDRLPRCATLGISALRLVNTNGLLDDEPNRVKPNPLETTRDVKKPTNVSSSKVIRSFTDILDCDQSSNCHELERLNEHWTIPHKSNDFSNSKENSPTENGTRLLHSFNRYNSFSTSTQPVLSREKQYMTTNTSNFPRRSPIEEALRQKINAGCQSSSNLCLRQKVKEKLIKDARVSPSILSLDLA